MNVGEAYLWLIEASRASHSDAFDIHVVASIFALALDEAERGDGTLCAGVGLDSRDLADVADMMFPAAAAALHDIARDIVVVVDDEERQLRDLLLMYATRGQTLTRPFAAMVARRCARPHHLWQDLGLRDRAELSEFMRRRYPLLAEKNSRDMKWKKFLYRLICQSEGFGLCTAPLCSDCEDFFICFDSEEGDALLARIRNQPHVVTISS